MVIKATVCILSLEVAKQLQRHSLMTQKEHRMMGVEVFTPIMYGREYVCGTD